MKPNSHTIYELTDGERATMKKLIDMGLVVTIGEYAKAKHPVSGGVAPGQHDATIISSHGTVQVPRASSNGPAGDGWILMNDRQPADFQTVLCVNSNGWMTVANRFHKGFQGWNGSHVSAEDTDDGLVIGDIRYWRELPSSPYATEGVVKK